MHLPLLSGGLEESVSENHEREERQRISSRSKSFSDDGKYRQSFCVSFSHSHTPTGTMAP
jgi:hypothetical protein